jgi:hypothetical protein
MLELHVASATPSFKSCWIGTLQSTSPLQQDEFTAVQGNKPANANSVGKQSRRQDTPGYHSSHQLLAVMLCCKTFATDGCLQVLPA